MAMTGNLRRGRKALVPVGPVPGIAASWLEVVLVEPGTLLSEPLLRRGLILIAPVESAIARSFCPGRHRLYLAEGCRGLRSPVWVA